MSNEVDWNVQTADKKHWDQRAHVDMNFSMNVTEHTIIVKMKNWNQHQH